MISNANIYEVVKKLDYETKKNVIKSYIGRELDFQKELKILFERMYPTATIEILQGNNELGKDLVIIEKDPIRKNKINAIIVKAEEKLRGNATNPIVTQIIQAVSHPFKILNSFEEYKVDFITVVNTGTITNSAQKSIVDTVKNTFQNQIIFWGTKELVDYFEEYYPEFFVSGEIERIISEYINKLDKILVSQDINDKDFIKPTLKVIEKIDKKSLLKKRVVSQEDYFDDLVKEIEGRKIGYDDFIKEITAKKDNYLIIGDAGSGKTTLSFFIIREILIKKLQEYKSNNIINNLPVILRASKLKKENIESFEEFILKINEINKSETDILCIDGIDELDRDLRLELKYQLQKYKEKYPNTTLILTSRKIMPIIDDFETFNQLELMPYELSKAIEFIKEYFIKFKLEEELLDYLEESLKEWEETFPLYPLSLKLLINVVREHKEIPSSITELYNRYIDIIVGKSDNAPEIDKLFEPDIKKDFFAYLAHEYFLKKNTIVIEKKDFEDAINNYVQDHSHIQDKESFEKSLLRSGLLQIKNNEIQFSHKSFLDYFIAYYYILNEERENVYELYFTDEWEEVFLFYIGLKTKFTKQDSEKLFLKLQQLKDNFKREFLTLYLGKVLQYGWHTPDRLKIILIKEGINQILNFRKSFIELLNNKFEIEIPDILIDLILLNFSKQCYNNYFLEQPIKNTFLNKKSLDVNEVYFNTLYIINNLKKISEVEINQYLEILYPNIKRILEDKDSLKQGIISLILTDAIKKESEKKHKIINEELKEKYNSLIHKTKQNYSALLEEILPVKRKKLFNKFYKK